MFSSILACLNGTDCDASVLAASLALAGRSAHIQCLRLVPDPAAIIAQSAQVDMGGWMILGDTVDAIQRRATDLTKGARENMVRFAEEYGVSISDPAPGAAGVTISWHEAIGEEFDQIVKAARYHDVTVLAGGADRAGRLPEEALGGIILGSGRPVLLAPQTVSARPYKNIAVAWKDTAEAARAITAAMPVLEKAETLDVYRAYESGKTGDETADSGERIAQNIRQHGFRARSHTVTADHASEADAVLNTVRDSGADLLVMGAYGHSRIREFIFGGFTQRVLKGATVAVLMFH